MSAFADVSHGARRERVEQGLRALAARLGPPGQLGGWSGARELLPRWGWRGTEAGWEADVMRALGMIHAGLMSRMDRANHLAVEGVDFVAGAAS